MKGSRSFHGVACEARGWPNPQQLASPLIVPWPVKQEPVLPCGVSVWHALAFLQLSKWVVSTTRPRAKTNMSLGILGVSGLRSIPLLFSSSSQGRKLGHSRGQPIASERGRTGRCLCTSSYQVRRRWVHVSPKRNQLKLGPSIGRVGVLKIDFGPLL